jgi:hypothetical protein
MTTATQQPWQFLDAVPMMEIEVVTVRNTAVRDIFTFHIEKSRIEKVLTHCFYDAEKRKYFKKDGMGDRHHHPAITYFGMRGDIDSFTCRKWDETSQQRVADAEQRNKETQIILDLFATDWQDERLASVRHTIHRIVQGKRTPKAHKIVKANH